MMTHARLLLRQMNDALFPVGTFSHSYGLETYIRKDLVRNAGEAKVWLRTWLGENFLYGDLLCARLAREAAARRDLQALVKLEETARASRGPRELREAAQKTGSRFVKTLQALLAGGEGGFFRRYAGTLVEAGPGTSYAAAYGAACGCLDISPEDAMEAFVYAQCSGMVVCCVKTIPLSQTEGQVLLSGLFDTLRTLLEKLPSLGEEDLYRSCAGFDLRAMEHENLYSRMYMS